MVQEKIRKLLPEMTPKFREIGSYILDHDQSVAFASIYAVSEASGASNASLVRFAKSLGFEGYQELKHELQDEIRHRLNPYDKIALAELDLLPEEKRLQKLFQNEINNLRGTFDNIKMADLGTMAESIRKARKVFISGFGTTRHMVGMFEYALLSSVDKDVAVVTGSVSDYSPVLKSFAADDVMFIMTFPPYSEEVKHVARVAKERGGTLNLLTDSASCPIYPLADTAIKCVSNSLLMTNSFVGLQSILHILVHLVFLNSKDSSLRTRSQTIDMQENGYTAMHGKNENP